MTLGNVMALWQNDLRRLLAYSSIAHAGYMLLGLGGGAGRGRGLRPLERHRRPCGSIWPPTPRPRSERLPSLEHLGRPDRRLDAVDELAGLGRTRPPAAAVLAVCMFSLAGVPPLGRLLGEAAGLRQRLERRPRGRRRGEHADGGSLAAAIVGVFNAAVAAAYYLRIVAVMYFRTPLATPRAEGGAGAWWAAVACACW